MAANSDRGERPWALLSPYGTYHKLKGPSFFVGRHEDVDLVLKVNISYLIYWMEFFYTLVVMDLH